MKNFWDSKTLFIKRVLAAGGKNEDGFNPVLLMTSMTSHSGLINQTVKHLQTDLVLLQGPGYEVPSKSKGTVIKK